MNLQNIFISKRMSSKEHKLLLEVKRTIYLDEIRMI